MRFLFSGMFFYFFLLSCSQNTMLHYSHTGFPEDDFTTYAHSAFTRDGTGRRIERFVLGGKKTKIDKLIGVDTSESTHEYIQEVGLKSQDFFYYTAVYDWQAGFFSTDHGDHSNPFGYQQKWTDYINASHGSFGNLMPLEDAGGRLLRTRILTPRMRNYREIFLHTVSHYPEINCNRPPYCQGGLEQPLRSFKSAMERIILHNSPNSVLVRPDAQALVFLLIGINEQERSEDKGRATRASQIVRTFKWMRNYLHNPNKRLFVYSIGTFGIRKGCLKAQKEKSEHTEIASFVAELANHEFIEGKNISICHENYGQALRYISHDIKSSLQNSVMLQLEPISKKTVDVQILEAPNLKWDLIDGRKIVFKNRISDESLRVSVSYIPKTQTGI